MIKKIQEAKEKGLTVKLSYTTVALTGSSAAGKTSFLNLLNKNKFIAHHHSTNVADSKQVVYTVGVVGSGQKSQWIDLSHKNMLEQLKDYLKTKIPIVTLTSMENTTHCPVEDIIASARNLTVKDVSDPNSVLDGDPDDDSSLGDVWKIVNFLDTGGQPEFVNLFPAISSSIILTFIVLNMRGGVKSLDEPVKVIHRVKGVESYEPYCLHYTNLHLIKLLMAFSKDSCIKEKPPLLPIQQGNKNASTSYQCCVGTHADMVTLKEIQEIEKKLKYTANELNCNKFLWEWDEKILFPINNKTAGGGKNEDPLADKIRTRIQYLVEDSSMYDVPIAWLIMLLEMQKVCTEGKKDFLTFSKVFDICKEGNLIKDEKEIRNALLLFHHMGVLFYYHDIPEMCQYVITNHKWLFEKLSSLISLTFERKGFDNEAIKKFKYEGLLSKSFIDQINLQADIETDCFIALLKHLKVIAELDADNYFMPCVLRSNPTTSTILDQYGNLQHDKLLVHFVISPIPRGFFCCLVVKICQNLPKNWLLPRKSTEEKQHTYNDLITFHTSDTGHSISLIDKIAYFEIQIRHQKTPPPIHYNVRQFLTMVFKAVSNHLKLDYQQLCYGFSCNCGESEAHIASLPKELDPVPKWINCPYDVMELTPSHMIWFLQQDTDQSREQAISEAIGSVLEQEVQMWELIEFVIPRVKAQWRELAYCMRYSIGEVDGFAREGKGLHDCCKKLFMNWLNTDHGPKPKNYKTLLQYVRDIDNLTVAAETVEKELIEDFSRWKQYGLNRIKKDGTHLPEDIKDEVLQNIIVLLISVNPLETSATYSYMKPLDDHNVIYRYYQDRQQTKVVYYIGKYGLCPAAIRGDIDFENASTVLEMAGECFPNFGTVISVGIACGIEGKVKLCDVLISSKIVNYVQEKDEHGSYLPKGEPITVLPEILNLFTDEKSVNWPKNVNRSYLKDLKDDDERLPTLKHAVILSGSFSFNDPATKETLTRNFIHATRGIEMGGGHLIVENEKVMISTIIIKAVCDFGGGRYYKIYKFIGALLAADLVHKCLKSSGALRVFEGKMRIRQMLQEAIRDGLTINVRHAKILFCGAAKAGKTSFCRLLRNEEYETCYKSSPLGNAHQVLVENVTDKKCSDEGEESVIGTKVHVAGEEWITIDSKSEAKLITQRLIGKWRKVKSASRDRILKDTNTNTRSDYSASHSSHHDNVQSNNNQNGTKSVYTNSNNAPNSSLNEDVSGSQPVALTSSINVPTTPDIVVESPNENVQESKKIDAKEQIVANTHCVNATDLELDSMPKTWDLLTLLDTGGQPEFINILPAINFSTSITFIVFNMSSGKECLKSLVEAEYVHEERNYPKHKSKYTTIELLKCLLFSTKFSAMKQNFKPQIVKRISNNEHLPSEVCIIGTHADKLKEEFGERYDEEVSEINKEVKCLVDEMKENKGKNDIVFWCKCHETCVFPMDNTISRVSQINDFKTEIAEGVKEIREFSNEVLRKNDEYEIPITWFILELELRSNDKCHCISLNEVKHICDKIMQPYESMDIDNIKEILKFYHTYGMLLYFSEVKGMNNFVITDPQWLFKNLTKILMCKYQKKIKKNNLFDSMMKGICHMELLKLLDLDLQGVELVSFVALLEHLKVIAPMKTIKDAYFIPSVLPQYDDKEQSFTGEVSAYTVDKQNICEKVEPLLIQFTFGTIPRGLLGFLVTQLHQDKSNPYHLYDTNDQIHQYADLICFCKRPHWYIFIRDRIFYLELQVRVRNNKRSYHYEAQTAVTKALITVCEEFNWEFSDFCYGFFCHKHNNGSQCKHLALLETNPPYVAEIPDAWCKHDHVAQRDNCHMIWFKNLQEITKQVYGTEKGKQKRQRKQSSDLESDSDSKENPTSSSKPKRKRKASQQDVKSPDHKSSLLAQEAQMFELTEIVIPKIKAEWKHLANCMRYSTQEIKGFKKDSQDSGECCENLLDNWISTGHGPKPKTYKTLLKHIKKINNLATASKAVEKELIEALKDDSSSSSDA